MQVATSGTTPISITMHGNLVYVLNQGNEADSVLENDGNIVGFLLNKDGTLSMIPNSARPLSAPSVGAAEVSFNPEGTVPQSQRRELIRLIHTS